MTESESVALPFGDSPMLRCFCNEGNYTRTIILLQVQFGLISTRSTGILIESEVYIDTTFDSVNPSMA